MSKKWPPLFKYLIFKHFNRIVNLTTIDMIEEAWGNILVLLYFAIPYHKDSSNWHIAQVTMNFHFYENSVFR